MFAILDSPNWDQRIPVREAKCWLSDFCTRFTLSHHRSATPSKLNPITIIKTRGVRFAPVPLSLKCVICVGWCACGHICTSRISQGSNWVFPTQRQRKSGAAPPPPSIRSCKRKPRNCDAAPRVFCCARACDQTAPVYHQRYSHPDGVAACRAHFRAPSPSLNLAAAVLFLVTQEMFSQSPPPNRGKQLAKLIKFSPPQREHRNDGYCAAGAKDRDGTRLFRRF